MCFARKHPIASIPVSHNGRTNWKTQPVSNAPPNVTPSVETLAPSEPTSVLQTQVEVTKGKTSQYNVEFLVSGRSASGELVTDNVKTASEREYNANEKELQSYSGCVSEVKHPGSQEDYVCYKHSVDKELSNEENNERERENLGVHSDYRDGSEELPNENKPNYYMPAAEHSKTILNHSSAVKEAGTNIQPSNEGLLYPNGNKFEDPYLSESQIHRSYSSLNERGPMVDLREAKGRSCSDHIAVNSTETTIDINATPRSPLIPPPPVEGHTDMNYFFNGLYYGHYPIQEVKVMPSQLTGPLKEIPSDKKIQILENRVIKGVGSNTAKVTQVVPTNQEDSLCNKTSENQNSEASLNTQTEISRNNENKTASRERNVIVRNISKHNGSKSINDTNGNFEQNMEAFRIYKNGIVRNTDGARANSVFNEGSNPNTKQENKISHSQPSKPPKTCSTVPAASKVIQFCDHKKQDNYIDKIYAYADKGLEVKHALTPLAIGVESCFKVNKAVLPLRSPDKPNVPENESPPMANPIHAVQLSQSKSSKKVKNAQVIIKTAGTQVPGPSGSSVTAAAQSVIVTNANTKSAQSIASASSSPVLEVPSSSPVLEVPKLPTSKVPPKQRIKRKLSCSPDSGVPSKKAIKSNYTTVLNIPSFTVSMPPLRPNRKPKISKLDLATLRKKARRQRRMCRISEVNNSGNGASILGTSLNHIDSSSSSSDSDDETSSNIDLWIKSGPPLRIPPTRKQLSFLKLFELTTYAGKNSLEVQRIERRRHYYSPLSVDISYNHDQPKLLVDLPVPFGSPNGLNHEYDFKLKSNFLHILGLGWVTRNVRNEMEKAWQKVIIDRLKRSDDSSLTHYYLQASSSNKPIEEDKKPSDNLSPVKTEIKIENIIISKKDEELFKIPLVHQYGHTKRQEGKIDVELAECKTENIENDDADTESSSSDSSEKKWPGVFEMIEMYHKYNKDRTQEVEQLRQRKRVTKELIAKQQHELRLLEAKLKELFKKQHNTRQDGKILELTTDKLTNIVNALR